MVVVAVAVALATVLGSQLRRIARWRQVPPRVLGAAHVHRYVQSRVEILPEMDQALLDISRDDVEYCLAQSSAPATLFFALVFAVF